MARHVLIAVGTAEYPHLRPKDQRPQLVDVVNSVAGLFTNVLRYERDLENIALNEPSSGLRMALDRWFAAPERDPSDWAVLYYTGHGEVVGSSSLYLLTSDYQENLYVATALNLGELANLVLAKRSQTEPRRIKNLLVIIDACFAGAGTVELTADLAENFRVTSQSMFYVLGAALPREEAKAGALARALIDSIADLSNRCPTQEFLYFDQIIPAINSRLRVHDAILSSVFASKTEPQFFPNPNFVDTLGKPIEAAQSRRAIVDPDVRARLAEISRNAVFDSQAVLLFSGRTVVLEKLTHFLANPDDNGTRVVIGGPGAGKSAVLGQIFQRSLQVRPFDLALQLKGMTYAQVAERLGELVGSTPAPKDILDSVKSAPGTFYIILDSLDEAIQPSLIADRLLRPLSAIRSVKLIIGSQVMFARMLDATEIIDIDAAEYAKVADIAEYVEALLLRAAEPTLPTPYANNAANAGQIAAIVSERAYPNFLVARLLAEDLLSRPTALSPHEAAAMAFAPTVSGALNRYIARFGDNETRARDLLRPLAYAEGRGLPWDNIWAPLSARLSGRHYEDSDVRWLLENAASFVLEAQEHGHSVFRLFHQALRQSLREGAESPTVQEAFSEVLLESIPRCAGSSRPNWQLSNHYIRSYLAVHAALADRLDSLVTDAEFLVVADQERLLQRLRATKSDAAQSAVKAYLRAVFHFQNANKAERLAYLELASYQTGVDNFINSTGSEQWPWRVAWLRWSPISPSRTVARHSDWVRSVVFVQTQQRQFIVSASWDGIQVRYLTGALLWEMSEYSVVSLAMARIGGRDVVAAGCKDGNVRLWDLLEGSPLGEAFGGHSGEDAAVRAVRTFEYNGCQCLVSAGNDGTIRFWIIERQEPLFAPLQAFNAFIQDVALTTIDGRLFIIAAGADPRALRIWEFGDRSLWREFPVEKLGCAQIRALAVGLQNARPIIAIATDGGGIRIVEPVAGSAKPLVQSTWHDVDKVAVGDFHSTQVIAGDLSKPIGIWDLDQEHLLGSLSGHKELITALDFGQADGRNLLISGSYDRTVRVWDLDDALKPATRSETYSGIVRKVGIAQVGNQAAVVCFCKGPRLQIWDLNRGASLGEIQVSNWDDIDIDEFISADLAFAASSNRIVIGGYNQSRVFQITELGRWQEAAIRHSRQAMLASAVGLWEGRSVLAAAHVVSGSNGRSEAKFWNLNEHKPVGRALEFEGIVRSIALSHSKEKSILAGMFRKEIVVYYAEQQTAKYVVEIKRLPVAGTLAAEVFDGEPVVAYGAYDGFLTIINPDTGIDTSFKAHDQEVRAVLLARVNGLSVVISGGEDGILSVSSLAGTSFIRVDVDGTISSLAIGRAEEVVVGTLSGVLVFHIDLTHCENAPGAVKREARQAQGRGNIPVERSNGFVRLLRAIRSALKPR